MPCPALKEDTAHGACEFSQKREVSVHHRLRHGPRPSSRRTRTRTRLRSAAAPPARPPAEAEYHLSPKDSEGYKAFERRAPQQRPEKLAEFLAPQEWQVIGGGCCALFDGFQEGGRGRRGEVEERRGEEQVPKSIHG